MKKLYIDLEIVDISVYRVAAYNTQSAQHFKVNTETKNQSAI